ncbi:hypothetical protein SS05631_a49240 (plasmid) [Sinorhizobium sp. CCBAU 05631]|nr:hypothetical protein SS05631_a49240 [Sinorhizobium sp. CCBAU 05631]
MAREEPQRVGEDFWRRQVVARRKACNGKTQLFLTNAPT